MSISGGAMILAVLLVRMFAKGRTPRRLFLILWGVAVLRLLLPFSLPFEYSIRSMLPKEQTVLPSVDVTPTENIPVVPFVPSVVTEEHNEENNVPATPSENRTIVPQKPNTQTSGKEINVFAAVYFAVGGLMLCTFAFYGIVTCRKFTKNSFEVTENKFGAKNIRVSLSADVTTPLTYGIFRPVILLPESTNLKDTETLKYVLMHEETHIKHFDGIKKLLLVLTLCVHWFNPLVWVMLFVANRDMELACDESVINKMGGSSRKSYALALLNMEESRRRYSVFTSAFGKNAVEERVKTIVSGKKRSVAALLASVLIVGAVFAVFGTSAVANDDEKDNIISEESETDTSFEISETSEEIAESELQWPSELLPEDIPVPPYTEIYSVEHDGDTVRIVLFGKKAGGNSYLYTFLKKLMGKGYIPNKADETGSNSYYRRDGLKVTAYESDIWSAYYGEHLTPIAENSPTGYAFEIVVEPSEPIGDHLYWKFPDENTDLGLEEIVFDEWPTEHLPENFPNPYDSLTTAKVEEWRERINSSPAESLTVRSIEQRKNGIFIAVSGETGDFSAYFEAVRQSMGFVSENPPRTADGYYLFLTAEPVWFGSDGYYYTTFIFQVCPPNEYIKK